MDERVPELETQRVIGQVKLDLVHPRTGKVLKSVEAENEVNNWWQAEARRTARSYFWSGNPAQPTDETAYPVIIPPYVALMDSGEAPGSLDVNGKMTAWAAKSAYAGASPRQGTIVAAECASSRTMSRYVWEWPTTAGNGFIKSVGMVDNIVSDVYITPHRLRWGDSYNASPNLYRGGASVEIDLGNGLAWGYDANQVFAYEHWFVPSSTPEYSTPEFRDPVMIVRSVAKAAMGLSTVTGVGFDGTNLYVTGNSGVIKKFAYPTIVNATPTVTTLTVPGRSALNRITFDGSYIWVAEGSTVYRVDKTSGAIERSFSIVDAPTGNLWWHETRRILIASNNTVVRGFDVNGNIVFEIGAFIPPSSASQNSWMYVGNNEFFASGYYYSGGSRYTHALGSLSMMTRSVLGVEIEKTNLTGMKLTYTFNFA